MRVVFDLQACQAIGDASDASVYALALLTAMADERRGHELWLVLNGSLPRSVDSLRASFAESVPRDHIAVFTVAGPVAGRDPRNEWRRRVAERVREAAMAELEPDVVLVSGLFEGFADDAVTSVATLDAAGFSTAVIHGGVPPLAASAGSDAAQARLWVEEKLRSLRVADLVLAATHRARMDAGDDRRVVLLPPAADRSLAAAPGDDASTDAALARAGIRRSFVLYAGPLDALCDVEQLIDAYATLSAALRGEHQLVLAGRISASCQSALRAFAIHRGLANGEIVTTGSLTGEMRAVLLRRCTVFVGPLRHGGLLLPLRDAMGAGAPVIALRSDEAAEAVGHEGALFAAEDRDAMAAAISKVLSDPAWRSELRKHARGRMEGLSWRAGARQAWDALEALHPHGAAVGRRGLSTPVARPRLAFVSPLPPERSGVAEYNARLLPALMEHYAIELIADQRSVALSGPAGRLPVRDMAWFEDNAEGFDRVLYHVGNSPFHAAMLGALGRHPGTVALHDFFLGDLMHWLDLASIAPGSFRRTLFASHGYAGLTVDATSERRDTVDRFPCNKFVLDAATGIIAHSTYAAQLPTYWYGTGAGYETAVATLARPVSELRGREAARRALGLGVEDFLLCSFGFVHATKLHHRVLAAWIESGLSADARCRLVFVGEDQGGDYSRDLQRVIRAGGGAERFSISGFASAETYQTYLAAADAAVQLRGVSRGETSGAVIDCLANGLPLIVNACGAMAEIPTEVAVVLPFEFTDRQLADAIGDLAGDRALRERLSAAGREFVVLHHAPERVAASYRDAIERFATGTRQRRYRDLVRSIVALPSSRTATDGDWVRAAASIATNLHVHEIPQLLVDISVFADQDLKSGIERVVRSVLPRLLKHPPAGFRVEPVIDAGGRYFYARRFACQLLGAGSPPIDDAPIEVRTGDRFFGLDWSPHTVQRNVSLLQKLRAAGVQVHFVVYDLLPALRPEFFLAGMQETHTLWLKTIAAVADGIVCISRSVADELADWLDRCGPWRSSPLDIAWFHLGADIVDRDPGGAPTAAEADLLDRIAQGPSFLMVGTIEPRKGHAQTLDAFELLWRQGVEVTLVIVGRKGWMVDDLVERLNRHPERGRRLHWLGGASDALLARVYRTAHALLAPSHGEGFGLPVIEGARNGLPIIARDIPVFREVAGEHALYFQGEAPGDIARAIEHWLELDARGQAPPCGAIRAYSWDESVDELMGIVLGGKSYRRWAADVSSEGMSDDAELVEIDFAAPMLPRSVLGVEGLSGVEPWGRWSDARLAPAVRIRFCRPVPMRGSIAIAARAFGPNTDAPMHCRMGEWAREFRVGGGDTTMAIDYEVDEPIDMLEIIPSKPKAPEALGLGPDPRQLGIGLIRLTMVARTT
jgi:glycosyltransferase involved in cell wall biosynthesis